MQTQHSACLLHTGVETYIDEALHSRDRYNVEEGQCKEGTPNCSKTHFALPAAPPVQSAHFVCSSALTMLIKQLQNKLGLNHHTVGVGIGSQVVLMWSKSRVTVLLWEAGVG